jgi:hypothetical protein
MLFQILLLRLSPYVDEIIRDHKCGFRLNRSTTYNTLCIHQILEKKWEYNETVHQLFIDFKKAYNSVRREVLYNILIESGVPMKIVSNLWGDNTDRVKNTETLIDTKKEVSLIANAEKIMYILLFHHQTAEQNNNIMTVNRSFENVAQFKYLGMTLTNQNLIQSVIKRRQNSGNACCHSVQKL